MFFIYTLGRRRPQHQQAETLPELGRIVTRELANLANNSITVSVGLTDKSVMPYVRVMRNVETDMWQGEAGDSIKLGIQDGLIEERDPIDFLGIKEIGTFSFAEDTPPVSKTASRQEKPKAKNKTKTAPKDQKLTNEEKMQEAKRIVDDLFDTLYE